MLKKASRVVIWPGSHKEYTEPRKLDIKTPAEHWKEKIAMPSLLWFAGPCQIMTFQSSITPSDPLVAFNF